MLLTDWLTSINLSDADFGKRLDPPVSAVTVWRWRTGARHPRPVDVRRIMRVTGGAVTANDFLAPQKRRSRRDAEAPGVLVSA